MKRSQSMGRPGAVHKLCELLDTGGGGTYCFATVVVRRFAGQGTTASSFEGSSAIAGGSSPFGFG